MAETQEAAGTPANQAGVGHGNAGEITLLVAAVASVVALAVYWQKDEVGDVLASAVLFLSSFYCSLIAALSFKAEVRPLGRMIWAFVGFEGFKTLLVALYCAYGAGKDHAAVGIEGPLTWACFGAVLAVTYSSIRLIDRAMEAKGGALASRLSRLLAVDAFLPLVSMGALFLYATYFLTFAVAFHDLGHGGGALYAQPIAPPDSGKARSPESVVPGSAGGLEECEGDVDGVLPEGFAFPRDRASLACTRALRDRFPAREWLEVEDVQGHVPRIAACQGLSAGEVFGNLRTTACIERFFKRHEGPRRARITLLGHAGDGSASPELRNYTRYELSLARVQQVHSLLSEIREQKNRRLEVEWLFLPMSGEEHFLGSPADVEPALALDRRASVEVRWQNLDGVPADLLAPEGPPQRRSLELLDYLYFMVYTITTTGYGDLVPQTPEVKFATVVANLFEVFFLVVAINVLIGCVLDHGRSVARSPSGD